MPTYRITNKHSGHCFGEYGAADEADALEVLARDAGYADLKAACEVAPGIGELLVELVEKEG